MTICSRRVLLLVFFSSFLLPPSSFLRADGGVVRLREQAGGYDITVFTSPTPLRAGLVDVSVMVMDAATGQYIPATRVTVRMTARGTGDVLEYPATTAAATNKLLHAAVFQLPEPGWWDVAVAVEARHGPALLRLAVQADEPPPRWLALWLWFAWPVLAVALFGLHQTLVRRRKGDVGDQGRSEGL